MRSFGPPCAIPWPVCGSKRPVPLLAGTAGRATEDFVQKLALAMGAANIDEAVQAVLSLRSAGVADDLVERVAGRLEGERPETCPVCGVKIAQAQRLDHLRSVHGHVELDGVALPRPQALARLWDRVFLEGSQPAHDRLLTLLDVAGESPETPGVKPHPYVAALEEALAQQSSGKPPAEPNTLMAALERLVHCLRHTKNVVKLILHLLRSKERRPARRGSGSPVAAARQTAAVRPVYA